MPPGDIDLVVFDLGRVLVRICDNWAHACKTARLPSEIATMSPETRQAMRDLTALHETGRIELDEFARRTAPLLAVSPSCVIAMSGAYLIEPFPGVDQVLDDICGAGIKTACLSNTNASHWQQMCATSGRAALPMHKLDWAFGSHSIGVRKPAPAIYRHVERVTGIPPGNILFFDDLTDNVAGAIACGWNAVRIMPDRDPMTQVRDALRWPLNRPAQDVRIAG